MSRQSFSDPLTGAMLHGADDLVSEVPEARLFFGRKLGYTDEEIRSMWLKDARRPRYIDVSQMNRVMSKAEAERYEVQRMYRGE